jgi:hypothetical protein
MTVIKFLKRSLFTRKFGIPGRKLCPQPQISPGQLHKSHITSTAGTSKPNNNDSIGKEPQYMIDPTFSFVV